MLALSVYCLSYAIAYAQDGNAGINEAATQVRGYFDTGTQLMYDYSSGIDPLIRQADPRVMG